MIRQAAELVRYLTMTKRSSSITIRDVAHRAGVSVATVSRYINQNAPVSNELSERIQQAMDELDFVPQAVARHLATQRTNAIGLVLPNMHNPFFAPMLAGIEEVVRQHEYNLLVATCHPAKQGQRHLPLGPQNTDGMLAFADSLDEAEIQLLYERGFPLVLIHQTPASGLNIPFVTVENKAATRELVEHLITAHGRRRIILLDGPDRHEDAYWREIGYKAALDAHGIPFDKALRLPGRFEREVAYNTMKLFLADPNHPPFDAIFTGDDDAAVGVYDALKEAALRIPEDVSVVGFDDSQMSPFLDPPLTTVAAPTEEVGRSAARQLLRLLNGQEAQRETLHPTKIVIRRSCGCPVDANPYEIA